MCVAWVLRISAKSKGLWAAAILGLGLISAAQAAPVTLLGSLEILTNPAGQLEQWRRFSRKYADEQAVYAMCSAQSLCSPELRQWRQLLKDLKKAPVTDRLDEVNRFVNATVAYRSDDWVPGRKDHWASPLEAIDNGGDCEDIALLKYVSLRELGFREDQLRIVVLNDTLRGRGHAVLTVRLKSGMVLVLDNLSNDVRPQEQMTRYQPIYGISGARRWMYLRYNSTMAAISQ